MSINLHWLTYLGIAATWTTIFSMSMRPTVRGCRNYGILASYILGIVMPFRVGFQPAVITWATCGIIAGGFYLLYDCWMYFKATEPGAKPQLGHLIFGLIAWPIMLPEVIEYSLAELGILKSSATQPTPEVSANPQDESNQETINQAFDSGSKP